jgi:alkylation response protein AidB-like acyl-CoA dehydrogenase
VRDLIGWLREYAAEKIDPRAIEERGWVGDDVIRDLGERGFCGLYVPPEYGGQGLSQTGYCRVFETLAQTTHRCRWSSACTSRLATRASPFSAPMSRRPGSCPISRPGASWPASR